MLITHGIAGGVRVGGDLFGVEVFDGQRIAADLGLVGEAHVVDVAQGNEALRAVGVHAIIYVTFDQGVFVAFAYFYIEADKKPVFSPGICNRFSGENLVGSWQRKGAGSDYC